jgi:general secretion pathway protein B
MSYILDALRRADAERERERGGVPGLHSMQVGSAAPAAPTRTPWVAAVLAAASLMVLLLLGWWFWPAAPVAEQTLAKAPPPSLPRSPPTSAAASAPAVTPADSSAAAGGGVTPARTPAPVIDPVPEPARASAPPFAGAPARPAVREPRAPAAKMVAPAGPSTATVRRSAAASAPSAAASASTPTRPEDKVVAFDKLPDDVKRALPTLAIGGVVYSDNPGSRLLMIGGQLLKEGDIAGPGVTLEQIRPRSAVLRWKDVRYEVRY